MIRNCKNLKEELIKLGFENYQAILLTANPWAGIPINKPPAPNAHILTCLNEFDIGYIFIIGSNADGTWYIHSVNTTFEMNSLRNVEGVQIVGKNYIKRDDHLPHKDQMVKEIKELVKIEAVKERFFLQDIEEEGIKKALKKWR